MRGGFSTPACAAEAATSPSNPRRSHRKFNQANTAPISSPLAQIRFPATADAALAADPNTSVSQAIRRSVRAPDCLAYAGIRIGGQRGIGCCGKADLGQRTADRGGVGLVEFSVATARVG